MKTESRPINQLCTKKDLTPDFRVADKHDDRRNNWIKKLDQRRGKNISAVAVANKNARIAWAVLTKKEPYKAVA